MRGFENLKKFSYYNK